MTDESELEITRSTLTEIEPEGLFAPLGRSETDLGMLYRENPERLWQAAYELSLQQTEGGERQQAWYRDVGETVMDYGLDLVPSLGLLQALVGTGRISGLVETVVAFSNERKISTALNEGLAAAYKTGASVPGEDQTIGLLHRLFSGYHYSSKRSGQVRVPYFDLDCIGIADKSLKSTVEHSNKTDRETTLNVTSKGLAGGGATSVSSSIRSEFGEVTGSHQLSVTGEVEIRDYYNALKDKHLYTVRLMGVGDSVFQCGPGDSRFVPVNPMGWIGETIGSSLGSWKEERNVEKTWKMDASLPISLPGEVGIDLGFTASVVDGLKVTLSGPDKSSYLFSKGIGSELAWQLSREG